MDKVEKEGRLIALSDAKPKRALKPVNEKSHCKHVSVIVDAKNRLLECADCSEAINPFDYIFNVALKEEDYFQQYVYYKKEVENLIKQRNDLSDEVISLKAKKKRLQPTN